jgi:hypothetical protein
VVWNLWRREKSLTSTGNDLRLLGRPARSIVARPTELSQLRLHGPVLNYLSPEMALPVPFTAMTQIVSKETTKESRQKNPLAFPSYVSSHLRISCFK